MADEHLIADLDGASFAHVQMMLQRGELSASAVLTAIRTLAGRASQRLNCVTGFIEGATLEAAHLDEQRARAGRAKGPLHGIPVACEPAEPSPTERGRGARAAGPRLLEESQSTRRQVGAGVSNGCSFGGGVGAGVGQGVSRRRRLRFHRRARQAHRHARGS